MRHVSIVIASGYIIIALLIGCVIYLWYCEWHKLEIIESKNRQIDKIRQKAHNVHMQMIELSLLGETILEWGNADIELYHSKCMVIDSMLRQFKPIYPSERIDSICHLLDEKERLMLAIIEVLDKQEDTNEEIIRQIPTIVKQSTYEQPERPKRKGFLGIFGNIAVR